MQASVMGTSSSSCPAVEARPTCHAVIKQAGAGIMAQHRGEQKKKKKWDGRVEEIAVMLRCVCVFVFVLCMNIVPDP